MIKEIEKLRHAGQLLRRDGNIRSDRAAVLSAVAEVWSAVRDGLDEWPPELQVVSVAVQFHLVRHGSPAATIGRLAPDELNELRRELLALVDAAERLDLPFEQSQRRFAEPWEPQDPPPPPRSEFGPARSGGVD